MAAKKRAPARSGRAGKARDKLADLPDLIPHAMVAEKFGITTTTLRNWVASGEFPEPHSTLAQTWLYRVDFIRAFLETGRWPEGVKFKRQR
jgi:hypothetical protein